MTTTDTALTPAEKAQQTRQSRDQQKKEAFRQLINDQSRALSILREIRDNPAASDFDRICAVELLHKLTTQ